MNVLHTIYAIRSRTPFYTLILFSKDFAQFSLIILFEFRSFIVHDEAMTQNQRTFIERTLPKGRNAVI